MMSNKTSDDKPIDVRKQAVAAVLVRMTGFRAIRECPGCAEKRTPT